MLDDFSRPTLSCLNLVLSCAHIFRQAQRTNSATRCSMRMNAQLVMVRDSAIDADSLASASNILPSWANLSSTSSKEQQNWHMNIRESIDLSTNMQKSLFLKFMAEAWISLYLYPLSETLSVFEKRAEDIWIPICQSLATMRITVTSRLMKSTANPSNTYRKYPNASLECLNRVQAAMSPNSIARLPYCKDCRARSDVGAVIMSTGLMGVAGSRRYVNGSEVIN